jgi:hypothetical protein
MGYPIKVHVGSRVQNSEAIQSSPTLRVVMRQRWRKITFGMEVFLFLRPGYDVGRPLVMIRGGQGGGSLVRCK